MKKILGVVIGRFQVPGGLHEGHKFLFNSILDNCDELLVLLGSANRPRSVANPFTYLEREINIRVTLTEEQNARTTFLPLNDYKYSNTQWMADVDASIKKYKKFRDLDVNLFGHFKEGNNYLKWFPQYKYQNVESSLEITGTAIRGQFKHLLPASVVNDMDYFEAETARFQNYPYPESLNFNCADAILECQGHILLIKRGHPPGVGNWALPGGFKNRNETFQDAAIRELMEETNVRVPKKVLLGSIKSTTLFDSPHRAAAGIPRNTLAVHIVVEPDPDGSLPRANGSDDAAEAKWVPIAAILNDYPLHDDHADIISVVTKSMPVIAFANARIMNGY
jgi:bifunctional NMN adenylyltransferase/nudix hydrolase